MPGQRCQDGRCFLCGPRDDRGRAMVTPFDPRRALDASERIWDAEIVPALLDYIRIPNKSPAYDPPWREAGHMDRAVRLIEEWCRRQPVEGLRVEVVRLGKRTPVILMEVPGSGEETVL